MAGQRREGLEGRDGRDGREGRALMGWQDDLVTGCVSCEIDELFGKGMGARDVKVVIRRGSRTCSRQVILRRR